MNIRSSILISFCLVFSAGCQAWDWNAGSQYAAYAGQQNNYNQQLQNQYYAARTQAMLNQSYANYQAQQRTDSINRRLDAIEGSLLYR